MMNKVALITGVNGQDGFWARVMSSTASGAAHHRSIASGSITSTSTHANLRCAFSHTTAT